MKNVLEVSSLSVTLNKTPIVRNVSFVMHQGEWLMLAGPNGAGKSTLVAAVSQGVPYRGSVSMDGEDVRRFSPSRLARNMGVLSQMNYAGYAFTVEEVVRMGRYAYAGGMLAHKDTALDDCVTRALADTGMTALRHHSLLTLSGGELQRVFLAQVLAQSPRLLILDEPANHLDLPYQKQLFSLISDWLAQGGRAVLSVVHDLSLARMYGTRALLMKNGEAVSQGDAKTTLSRENLIKAYDMDVFDWMRGLLTQWNDE